MNYSFEYGGCLELETTISKSYFEEFNNLIEFDCARSAIQYIIREKKYSRVWLPVYNCPSVYNRLKKDGINNISLYNINDSFKPEITIDQIEKGALVVWINYWGCMKNEIIETVINYFSTDDIDVLIDNSVAFFSPPKEKVYNVYSCRKFFGVADGAYLIGNLKQKNVLKKSFMSDNYIFLLKAIESGSNSAYSDYLNNEKTFDERYEPYEISSISKSILKSIDYERIKTIRKENFSALCSLLGLSNLDFDYFTDTPYVFPYFCKSDNLRKRLISNNIFVSQHWKHILEEEVSNDFEKDMSTHIIPLPIDQRYTTKDMEIIASIVSANDY